MAKARKKVTVHVVLDTNCLFTQAADELLNQETRDLVVSSGKLSDLAVKWYLPSVVKDERRRQMLRSAADLLPKVERLERLLGIKLVMGQKTLEERVDAAIIRNIEHYGLIDLDLNTDLVNWPSLVQSASRRKPPFDPGDKEKGFRDSLIIETAFQLASRLPKTGGICRVVIVSADELFREACDNRTSDGASVTALSKIDDLKTLINALASETAESFIEELLPKAEDLFNTPGSVEGLFSKAEISKKIGEKFRSIFDAAAKRNEVLKITSFTQGSTSFVSKRGQRIRWNTKIEVNVTITSKLPISKIAQRDVPTQAYDVGLGASTDQSSKPNPFLQAALGARAAQQEQLEVTRIGVYVVEVTWEVTCTTTGKLRKAEVLSLQVLDPTWE